MLAGPLKISTSTHCYAKVSQAWVRKGHGFFLFVRCVGAFHLEWMDVPKYLCTRVYCPWENRTKKSLPKVGLNSNSTQEKKTHRLGYSAFIKGNPVWVGADGGSVFERENAPKDE